MSEEIYDWTGDVYTQYRLYRLADEIKMNLLRLNQDMHAFFKQMHELKMNVAIF